MILNKLTASLDKKEISGELNIEIASITANSKDAGKGSLFIAIPGTDIDGHDFLDDSFNNGARAFITQRAFKKPGITNIIVPDCRSALAKLTAEFYNHPTKALTLIGITGTNGKTTTAFLIESILKQTRSQVGLLSTILYRFGTQTLIASHTTPGPLELQKVFRNMADAETKYAVMEVSSHGLQQKRVEQCHFDTVIFTNLTPEHLDYHKTMADYLKAKEILFTSLLNQSDKKSPVAIINTDDPSAQTLLNNIKRKTLTYGIDKGDIHTANIDISLNGIKADIITPEKSFSVKSTLIGHFNLYNILAAVSAALSLGLSTEEIKAGIEKAENIPGRMEEVKNNKGIKVFIDYAHTGDALKNVLKTISALSHRKIITIFGCGGDRDREKRPVMGNIAAKYSNILLVTSDNPRTEDPVNIIKEIEAGVLEENFSKKDKPSSTADTDKIYFLEESRSIAIKEGISMAVPGDVVLIAGKGHETYQISGNKKYHFDDREEAVRALKLCA